MHLFLFVVDTLPYQSGGTTASKSPFRSVLHLIHYWTPHSGNTNDFYPITRELRYISNIEQIWCILVFVYLVGSRGKSWEGGEGRGGVIEGELRQPINSNGLSTVIKCLNLIKRLL